MSYNSTLVAYYGVINFFLGVISVIINNYIKNINYETDKS